MNVTKSHTVNDVSMYQTITTGKLERVIIMKSSYGETASGVIRLIYENHFSVDCKYDTKVGPDGLETYIKHTVGEQIYGKFYDEKASIQVSEQMIKAAQRAKSSKNVVQSSFEDTVVIGNVEKLIR